MQVNQQRNSRLIASFFTRENASRFIEDPRIVGFITGLILINAVTLGLETDRDLVTEYGGILHIIDRTILWIFSLEILIKFYAYRGDFFKTGWNIFDLIIVGIAWIPSSGNLSVMRALRVLRILRLISVVPQLRRVISAIGYSIPGMVSVVGVLSLIFYVASVLATQLFGHHADPNMQDWFGSISASAYTLFQIMTLESWSMGVVRPTMILFPWSWMFFLPFIIVTSFAVLNFFIGIIVDSMQIAHQREAEEAETLDDSLMTKNDRDELLVELKALRREVQALRSDNRKSN